MTRAKGRSLAAIPAILAVLVAASAFPAEDPAPKPGSVAQAPAKPPVKLTVKFKADKIELAPDLRSAKLSGHVSVEVGDVRVTCKKLSLSYGAGKQVMSFEARGQVKLVKGDIEATAEELDYDASTRVAVLRGGCKVRSKMISLSGDTVTLEVETGKITVEKASGTIDLDDGGGTQ